jgi:hypothetical protein
MTTESGIGKDHMWVKALVLLLAFVALCFALNVKAAFFIAVLFAAVMLGVDCGIPYIVALMLLLVSSLFLVLNAKSAAEFFSVWAFYFLAIGVLAQFRDVLAESSSRGDNPSRKLQAKFWK